MRDQQELSGIMHSHFEDLWKAGDPWSTDRCEFEQAKYAHELKMLDGRHYRRALEIGCGSGVFTRLLVDISDQVLAIDVAESAIGRARQTLAGVGNVEFRATNIMEWDPRSEGPWDLITIGDTLSCIGWLYSFLDIGYFAAQLFCASERGGRVLLANTYGGVSEKCFRPWLTRTYRDLFINVGYRLEAEDFFRGTKNGVDIPVLISIFQKAPETAAEREEALW